jgi:hypothetical protein
VSGDEKYDAAALRTEIARVGRLTDLAERSLEVVAVIDALAAPFGITPVIVGGMAVYFWTEEEAFVTEDIDVVMEIPDQLVTLLAEVGFERAKDGRHWIVPDTDILLEAPGSHLDDDAVTTEVKLPSGRTASVLSQIDILIDRLDEFQATGHPVPAEQALALLTGLSEEESRELDARAGARRVGEILRVTRRLADELASSQRKLESDELLEIARDAFGAEYPGQRSP